MAAKAKTDPAILEERRQRQKEYKQRWRENNREKIRALKKAAYLASPDLRDVAKERASKWYYANVADVLEKAKVKSLVKKCHRHGITLLQYEAMQEAQAGKCAICGNGEPHSRKSRLNIDHDHETGKVRGLLCSKCNSAIGLLSDDVEVLASAIRYLEVSRG